jgi:hypothetical protein
MEMKPIALDVNVVCAGAHKSYGSLITQEHILDVTNGKEYLENNRALIVQDFLALALYDCSKLIFDDIKRRLFDGATPNSPN